MSLATVRDLLIIIGIYCYFVAWVYLHTYYASFGIATESLRLDYSSYLIFSYNVLTSAAFIRFAVWALAALIGFCAGFSFIIQKVSRIARKRWRIVRTMIMLTAMVALFPFLFQITRETALQNYNDDRFSPGELHRIEFIFRKNAGLDSASAVSNYALSLLSKDAGKNLRLLGETSEYFIVLNQLLANPSVGSFPEGAIYYIDKKDILVGHIILSSK